MFLFIGLSRLNITSGSRTYRIPSPTRPLITRNSFQQPQERKQPVIEKANSDEDFSNQKGFYISFDNQQPKRPKPPLRTKKGSPKKEKSYVEETTEANVNREKVCIFFYLKRFKLYNKNYFFIKY